MSFHRNDGAMLGVQIIRVALILMLLAPANLEFPYRAMP